MSIVLQLLSREFLSVLADVLSIIGFVLTIFVLYDTRKIRSLYKFKGRGPALIRDLSKLSLTLSTYLNQFEDFLPQIEKS